MKAGFRNKQFDFVLLFIILAILGVGLLMCASSGFVRSSYLSGDAARMMRSQFIYAALGLAVMIGVSFVDYRIYKKFAGIILWVIVGINLITPFIGRTWNDASRWISIGGGAIRFQPSEFLKVAVIIYLASVLSDSRMGERSKGWYGMITVIAPFGIALVSVLIQKHASATIIIALIGASIIIFAGMRWYIYLTGAVAGAGVVGLIVVIKKDLFEHIGNRLAVYKATFFGNTAMNLPADETLSETQLAQIRNSLWAIGSGGLTGAGFGKSIQKYSYLPEAYNDFVFAITAEELGFAGVTVIILLYLALILRGIRVAFSCKDSLGSLMAAGIIVMITVQTVFNMAVVSALIPVTGVGLPMFSHGGTSLVTILGSMGILLNIAKQSDYPKLG